MHNGRGAMAQPPLGLDIRVRDHHEVYTERQEIGSSSQEESIELLHAPNVSISQVAISHLHSNVIED
jgi:hypothetical protein